LMQVLGARRSQVLGQLALEGLILGLVGGAIGCIIGAVIVAAGASLFGIPMGIPFALLPLVLLISVSVVLLGTLPHAVRALRAWPVRTLRVEGL
ncbi:MAG: FtsX-like permease family protein, partial [Planctomycetota bacterium]|nr:FtsX-like permease family protein [Planctomycetota bacterium]